MSKDITWHENDISKKDREGLLKQKGLIIWFTGLSGSGKSTIANILQNKLFDSKMLSYILDGDNIRHGLNKDLGFDKESRSENIRRIGEVAKLFVDCGVIVITCFISPYAKDRDKVKKTVGKDFLEVFVKCPIDVCEKRDPKGLYKKAIKGEIKYFTGIDDPYEEPKNAEIVVDSDDSSAEECAQIIFDYVMKLQ